MKRSFPTLTALKYLFWLGPMLIIAGLSAGVVSGAWTAIPVGLMVAGVVIIGLWLLTLSRGEAGNKAGFWNRRATEASANALVATIAVLAILGLVNFLSARYLWRVDLTENQQFTLAPQTREVVQSLKQPVKAWVFDNQQHPQDRELLESYHRLGKDFTFEFVDPQKDPSLAKQLEVKTFGDVVLQQSPSQRKQFVQTVNAQERLSEVKLTNAIEQIGSDRSRTIYFLQGHGERPIEAGQQGSISQAVKLLKEKNIVSNPLNLAASKTFPTDATVVIVAGPQKPLLPPEVAALKTYLDKGGNVLLLIDPTTNPDPKLDGLLKEWGVTLDKRVAIDASGSGKLVNLGPADALVTQYGNHPITKELQGKLSFFSLARPVEVKESPAVKSTILLYSNDKSWAESNLQSQPLSFNPPQDLQGPLSLGVALSRSVGGSAPAKPNEKQPESRLVVIGNSTFATDGLFDQVANGDVFLNSVQWLSQDQSTLSVRPKEAKNRRIVLTTQQAALAGWLALGILPLLGFGAAVFVWWRRR